MNFKRRRAAICEAIEPRLFLSVARPSYNTGTGFFVSGGKIYDANGNEFIMKGVNAIHAWGSYNTNYNTIDQIAKTGANTARAVMYQDISTDTVNPYTDAANTPARRKAVVERYLANGMVVVAEDHASITTDADSRDPAALAEVTTHWIDNAAWLKQYEQGVILNIANEWGPVVGATGSNTTWRDSYITQVTRLRQGADGILGTADDITNLIEIDAAGYGQDYNSLALHAQQILDADPQHNIVFSIHLYGQWRDENRAFDVSANNSDYGPWDILTRLSSLKNRAQPLPLVIGEWAWEDFRDFSSTTAPYGGYRTLRVMQIADQLGIGFTGWSWNQSSPTTLNMVSGSLNNSTYNTNTDLSAWGDTLVNDPVYGFKASAVRATVFPIPNLPNPVGLPALPTSMPAVVKIILETTHTNVPEGGQAAVRVRLSSAPSASTTITTNRSSGDTNLTANITSLTFTPDNWNQYQTILLADDADADAVNGTAKFQLAAAGLLTTDFSAKEIDDGLPVGTVTLNPIADRKYTGSGTAASLAVTNTVTPQPTGAAFLKFDLTARGGAATSATLRVYKSTVTTDMTMRLHVVIDDSWTEAGTTGINASYVLLSKLVPNAAGYVEFDVTSLVKSQLYADGLVSFALSTASGSTTIDSREGTNKPQLVLTTAEAVPPMLVSADFDYSSSQNALHFTFSEDVSPSLSAVDVLLESISDPGTTLTLGATPTYDSLTQTATFTFASGTVPDGRYRATLIGAGVTDLAGNAMLEDHALTFFSLTGDANHDGAVNFDDLVVLAQNYNQSGRTYAQGDLTHDGVVNFDDLVILAQQYGKSIQPPPPLLVAAIMKKHVTSRAPVNVLS